MPFGKLTNLDNFSNDDVLEVVEEAGGAAVHDKIAKKLLSTYNKNYNKVHGPH